MCVLAMVCLWQCLSAITFGSWQTKEFMCMRLFIILTSYCMLLFNLSSDTNPPTFIQSFLCLMIAMAFRMK